MGKDTPDWGGAYIDSLAMPLSDMAELAVRLGSFISYDRSGSVMWADNFEEGLGKLTRTTTGTGSAVSLVADVVETGSFACLLHTGSSVNSNANIARRVEIFASDRIGLACSAKLASDVDRFRVIIYHHTGTALEWYEMRLDFKNRLLQVRRPGAAYTTLQSDVVDLATSGHFVRFKLVANLLTKRYDRVAFSAYDFGNLNLTPDTVGSVAAPYVEMQISNQDTLGAQTDIWVDNMYVTRLEPAR